MRFVNCLFFFLTCSSLLVSCQAEKKETERMYRELMNLHDEEMTRMETIYDLRQKLASLQDTLSNVSQKENIQHAIQNLLEADESMMNWMRNYQEPEPSLAHEEKRTYYSEQLKAMKEVKNLMDSSIDSAKAYLKNYDRQREIK